MIVFPEAGIHSCPTINIIALHLNQILNLIMIVVQALQSIKINAGFAYALTEKYYTKHLLNDSQVP